MRGGLILPYKTFSNPVEENTISPNEKYGLSSNNSLSENEITPNGLFCAAACKSNCSSNCGEKCASRCESACWSVCGGGADDMDNTHSFESAEDIIL